jgi:hypothetical protein
LEVVCIVIIKGYYREKVIYSALETESDIHFETNFFGKNDTHFETDGVFIFFGTKCKIYYYSFIFIDNSEFMT